MSDLLIKDIGDDLRRKLEARAKLHQRTVDAEARALLEAATDIVADAEGENIVSLTRRLFGPEHGVDLTIPPRGQAPERPPLCFEDDDAPSPPRSQSPGR